jgi:hypothetical protein
MTRVLICLQGNNGDCLHGALLARQIKHDTPDAHITYVTATGRAGLHANNPNIDEVWPVEPKPGVNFIDMTIFTEIEAMRRHARGEFDRLYLSQIWPNNLQNYDGSCRPSVLRSYGLPITVPIENIINFTDAELDHAAYLIMNSNFFDYEHRILFECQSLSGASYMTPDLAQTVAGIVYDELPNTAIMLISPQDLELKHPNTKHAKLNSLREVAALTRAATLFVGAGSGCTVIASSPPSQPLPMILCLSAAPGGAYSSFAHDFAYWGMPNDHILETTNESPVAIAAAIVEACQNGIGPARQAFHEVIPVNIDNYKSLVETLSMTHRYIDMARSVMNVAERYGWMPELQQMAHRAVVPFLANDISLPLKQNRVFIDKFFASLADAAKDEREIPEGGINTQRC